MKKITLRIARENIQGNDTVFSTVNIFKNAINNVTEQGVKIEDMLKRIRLMEIMEKHNDMDVKDNQYNPVMHNKTKTIELEDADFEYLKNLFLNVKWAIVSKFVVDTYNELNQ